MKRAFFAGTGTLTGFILRRDRLRLPIWILGLGGFVVLFVPVFENLLNTGDSRVFVMMMENPAMIAMVGPVYGADNYTTGAMYSNMMLLFSAMIAGVMNIFLITRHTRQDEELGRLEVIRSLPVGRLSNLGAALITALGANLLLAALIGFGMYALRQGGMDFPGCMLFGSAIGVIGLYFGAFTAVFCQITANNRTASAFSLLLLLVLYMMRAMGDIGIGALSLVSPLGLVLCSQAFVEDYWWPAALILIQALVLAAVSFALAGARDLGRGLISERPGRRHASFLLSGPFGLALKLLRSSIIIWAAVMFALAGMYGSVFGDLDSFIGNNELLKAIFMADPAFSLAQQFITMLLAIMSIIAALPVLTFAHRVAGEERRGHAELILGGAVSRTAQMGAYLLPAFLISLLLQFLSALGFWSVGSLVMRDIPPFSTFLLAAAVYLPAVWVMMGISLALVAWLPDHTYLSFLYLGYTLFSIYIGVIADLPEWTRKLTPYGYISKYPVEDISWLPLLILTVIAGTLIILAFIGYRRRELRMH